VRWVVIAAVAAGMFGVAGCTAGVTAPADVARATVRVPACASHLDEYPGFGPWSKPAAHPGPPVPGNPVAAVVCRYAGPDSALASSVALTSQAKVARLQRAMNESRVLPPGVPMFCMQSDGESAVVLFAYAQGTPERVVRVDPWCVTLQTRSARYITSGDAGQLVKDWSGAW
jgi:hypothetical protein